MKNEHDRFLNKVNKTPDCWFWVGSKYRGGYGHFRRKIKGFWKMYKTHRYSYEYYKGAISKGMFVCHHCDNPSCVNPDHLFEGTQKDNVTDMYNKGRKSKIIRNPKHNNLTFDIAKQIRDVKKHSSKILLKEIAFMFNTSIQQVSRIVNNTIWREEN